MIRTHEAGTLRAEHAGETVVLAMEAERAAAGPATTPAACQVFGVPLGAEAHADVLTLMTNLRRAGVNADMAFGVRGLKGALRAADRSGAAFAVLIGADPGPPQSGDEGQHVGVQLVGKHRVAERHAEDLAACRRAGFLVAAFRLDR